ncbi:MAG: flagellar basal body rod protein FlgB [Alphaproteobacteria bacterium]|nr:flagellar basal body rod protein FlgB [Alphaproteobacteria bacterium]
MDLKSISLFSSLKQKMDWLTERQKVLAQNIANANTPGYTPRDLKKISFKAHLDQTSVSGGLGLRVTEKGHIPSGGGQTITHRIEEMDTNFDMSAPDGNAVNLEDELIKMAETQMDYATAASLYRKHVGMLKTAIGRK